MVISLFFCVSASLRAEFELQDREKLSEIASSFESANLTLLLIAEREEGVLQMLRGVNLGVWTLVGLSCGYLIYRAVISLVPRL